MGFRDHIMIIWSVHFWQLYSKKLQIFCRLGSLSSLYGQVMYVMLQDFLMIVQCVSIRYYKHILDSTSEHLHVNLECPQSTLVTPYFSSCTEGMCHSSTHPPNITHALHFHSKILIGASLSKPHTSMTSLHLCVCMPGPTTYHTSLLALCLFCVICINSKMARR